MIAGGFKVFSGALQRLAAALAFLTGDFVARLAAGGVLGFHGISSLGLMAQRLDGVRGDDFQLADLARGPGGLSRRVASRRGFGKMTRVWGSLATGRSSTGRVSLQPTVVQTTRASMVPSTEQLELVFFSELAAAW